MFILRIFSTLTHWMEMAYSQIQTLFGLFVSRRLLSGADKYKIIIPSGMSIVRIPLGYALWATVAQGGESMLTQISIHALAGLTDSYDGLLARRLNCTSKVGAVLDPLCDKIYVFWCAAAYWDRLDHFTLAGIVTVEGLILTAQIVSLTIAWLKKIRLEEADLKATIWGKSKGAAECGALLAGSLGLTKMASVLLAIATLLAVGSVVEYQIKRARRLARP